MAKQIKINGHRDGRGEELIKCKRDKRRHSSRGERETRNGDRDADSDGGEAGQLHRGARKRVAVRQRLKSRSPHNGRETTLSPDYDEI